MQRSDTQRKLGWLYFRVLAPLVLVVAAVSALSVASVHVLGAVRAYVGGESRWSKARSLAVQALRDYAASHDPADLARYHAALAVPQGDRQAREQLSQPMPDMALVQQGFLQGENHPEDIAAMVQLFRRLSWLPVFNQALSTWTHADALIAQLQMQAAMLSSQVKGADLAGQQRTLTHIQQIDRDLLQTENAFSARLAEASRQTVMALTLGITLSAILLTLTSGWLIHRSLRRQHAQHLARAELAAQAQAADKVAQAQRAFLSRLSHELRTPLNAILGFAQLLAMDQTEPATDTQRQRINLILQAGRQLRSLIEDVLDLTKVESGDMALTIERVDARELLNQSLLLVDSTRQQHGVEIVNAMASQPLWVMADARRLQQIFLNLLSNACKYNRPQGRVRIWAEERRPDATLIHIEDTGIGLRPDEIGQLFQPFRRMPTKAREVEGTGLGLYIVQQFIERMQGRIELRSEFGVGSCFTLSLPPAPHDDTQATELG